MHGWICEFQTRSFDFKSVGATKAVAYENMRKGWLTHCQEFDGADENSSQPGQLPFLRVQRRRDLLP